jgi:hypothetical protein
MFFEHEVNLWDPINIIFFCILILKFLQYRWPLPGKQETSLSGKGRWKKINEKNACEQKWMTNIFNISSPCCTQSLFGVPLHQQNSLKVNDMVHINYIWVFWPSFVFICITQNHLYSKSMKHILDNSLCYIGYKNNGTVKWKLWNWHYGNLLLSSNTLYERRLYSRSQTIKQSLVSLCLVYFKGAGNILTWICDIWHTVYRKLFTVHNFCESFITDGVLVRNTGEDRRS